MGHAAIQAEVMVVILPEVVVVFVRYVPFVHLRQLLPEEHSWHEAEQLRHSLTVVFAEVSVTLEG